MDRVLVTGGAGFVGSHVVEHLLRETSAEVVVLDDLSTGHPETLPSIAAEHQNRLLTVLQGDVRSEDAVLAAMEYCSAVFHLAARVSIPASLEDPAGTYDVNVNGTLQVMEAARRLGIKRVVHASSCAVLNPDNPYSASKAAAETIALQYGAVCLRYYNVWGPRQRSDLGYAAVIPTFVERALDGQPLVIHGSGEQTRDFVHVRDVARANRKALGARSRVIEIGSGVELTINGLATTVAARVPKPITISYDWDQNGGVESSRADIEQAWGRLCWIPKTNLWDGLPEFIESRRLDR